MRLARVRKGHGLKAKLAMGVRRLVKGEPVPDVMRLLMYRPEFFGAAFARAQEAILRGNSEWSIGERELFAAFTARLNRCHF